jgi:hypothetical protein
MMNASITFDREWEAIANNTRRQLTPSVKQGLRRAGAAALQAVESHWHPGGGVPAWKAYTPAYARRKSTPGALSDVTKHGELGAGAFTRQLSHSATPDLIFTGALKQAAVYIPKASWPNPWTLVITPEPTVQRGKSPVRDYMNAVDAARPFYGLASWDITRVAEQFALGMMNALKGVADPVGRHLGSA